MFLLPYSFASGATAKVGGFFWSKAASDRGDSAPPDNSGISAGNYMSMQRVTQADKSDRREIAKRSDRWEYMDKDWEQGEERLQVDSIKPFVKLYLKIYRNKKYLSTSHILVKQYFYM